MIRTSFEIEITDIKLQLGITRKYDFNKTTIKTPKQMYTSQEVMKLFQLIKSYSDVKYKGLIMDIVK